MKVPGTQEGHRRKPSKREGATRCPRRVRHLHASGGGPPERCPRRRSRCQATFGTSPVLAPKRGLAVGDVAPGARHRSSSCASARQKDIAVPSPPTGTRRRDVLDDQGG